MKILLTILAFLSSLYAWADDYNANYSGSMSPNDYLFGSNGERKDPVFDVYRTVSLDVDLGVSADCGRLDFKSTIRGALKNILDTKYLGDMGKDIIGASPMLLTCYFSPTWCSILKSSRLRANMLAQLRLDQCSVIDKYVDSRSEDFLKERQDCVRQAIQESNGNFEEAMSSGKLNRCKNYYDFNLANWAGNKFGGKSSKNELLGSSAKWAGMNSEESNQIVSLVKSLVGDTVVTKGKVSVDFGPQRVQLTPRTHLMSIQRENFDLICKKLVPKVESAGGNKAIIDEVVSDNDLKKVNGTEDNFIDRQTLLSLMYLPQRQREMACKKLSDAISMSKFSKDMNKSIDFIISKVETNPNIPEKRKVEAARKRKALKDQVEMTLALYHTRNEPLNEVLYQINTQGNIHQKEFNFRKSNLEKASKTNSEVDAAIFDCADEDFCKIP